MTTETQAAKSPEQIITELRMRVEGGNQLTREEVREALSALRRNRLAAAESPSASKRRATPARSSGELLELLKKPVSQ